MENRLSIETPEYGILTGSVLSLYEVDALAKQRCDYIKFLGLYAHEGKTIEAFFAQNRVVFAEMLA